MGVNHYPVELREQVLTEYEFGLGGYRALAKKHGLKRDTVRDWVKTYGSKGDLMKKNKVEMKKETVKEIKEMSRKELEEQLEPVEINKCGAKRKSQLLKRKGIPANHKRIARICKEAGIETTNRRRKFPKNYYKTQKANEENLPKNELDRNFKASEPLI